MTDQATPPAPAPMSQSDAYLLGQIHQIVVGLRDGQAEQNKKIDKLGERIDGIDGRLRVVEQRSAVVGAVSGGAMGVGVALIVEGLKYWIKGGR